jgi:hypothetical protein
MEEFYSNQGRTTNESTHKPKDGSYLGMQSSLTLGEALVLRFRVATQVSFG